MELDDFKATWQKQNAHQSQLNKKNMEQIQSILREKTSGVLVNVKKKYEVVISVVLLGILGNLLLSPFLPWVLGVDGPVYTLPTELGQLMSILVVTILGILIIFFYWLKYTSLETTIPRDDLRLTLSESIKKLKRSLWQEIYFFLALYVSFFMVARSQSQFMGYGDFWDIFRIDVMAALIIGLVLIGYYLFRKVRQYKKYIQELKAYLAEFEEV